MGIRMLHRRAAQAQAKARAQARAAAAADPAAALPPVPAFAADASSARIPTGPGEAFRRAAARVRHRLTHREPAGAARPYTPAWRRWAELGRSYLALARTWLPEPRPVRTVTVFVTTSAATATAPTQVPPTLTAPPDGSAPPAPHPDPRTPGPDATP